MWSGTEISFNKDSSLSLAFHLKFYKSLMQDLENAYLKPFRQSHINLVNFTKTRNNKNLKTK